MPWAPPASSVGAFFSHLKLVIDLALLPPVQTVQHLRQVLCLRGRSLMLNLNTGVYLARPRWGHRDCASTCFAYDKGWVFAALGSQNSQHHRLSPRPCWSLPVKGAVLVAEEIVTSSSLAIKGVVHLALKLLSSLWSLQRDRIPPNAMEPFASHMLKCQKTNKYSITLYYSWGVIKASGKLNSPVSHETATLTPRF